ncbi:Uu.00g032950.m01.CDS01 [Anthostomella pinea]|uniref:Uu.00g032950.m01.CDS01 n=1 Tax=Anthostomella pinea TaxID=933095 RepID=A0AAI8V9D8_9PEZI|nr:Uu.00g032950.m01.CDS01 [Anthostomella pinea]
MSSWDVKGKFAIVTGAGSDIALRPEAEETLSRFPHPPKDGSPSAVFHQMDQSDWSQISETWDFALRTFGRVDLLCPGAGIWEPPTYTFRNPPGTSPQSKDDPKAAPGVYQIFAVNLMGPIRFVQPALDYWLQNKVAGNSLFVASLSA